MQKILFIGEDPTVSLRTSPQLQACSIETAGGGAEALLRLRQRAFELVLTDPKSSIQEDLALIDEIENIRPGVKTIILAPAATPEDVIAVLRARVFACFSRPFDVNEVAEMISKALQADNWRSGIEVLSADPNWIALRVNCQLLTAKRLLRFMNELRSDLEDPDRYTLLTAFREILLNAIEHGGGFDSERVIEVNAVRTKRAIVYCVRDPGPGFRAKPLPHAAINNPPDNPVAHLEFRETQGLRPGGFGILLAQQMVDELVFNEMGNEVLLIKHTS